MTTISWALIALAALSLLIVVWGFFAASGARTLSAFFAFCAAVFFYAYASANGAAELYLGVGAVLAAAYVAWRGMKAA